MDLVLGHEMGHEIGHESEQVMRLIPARVFCKLNLQNYKLKL